MLNIDEELFEAIEDHKIKEVGEFLKRGANPNAELAMMKEKGFIYTPLMGAVDETTYGGSREVVAILLQYGADINLYSKDGTSLPLSYAVYQNDAILVNTFLKLGANPNIKNSDFILPLYSASEDTFIDVAKLLLDNGAQARMNEYGSALCGCLSLQKATKNLHINTIELLLDYGADIMINDEDGMSTQEYIPELDADNKELIYKANLFLNPQNPPYLKLGEDEADKYIIYENKKTDEKINIYLLTDKQKHKDKKYLYADNKADAFVYWAYKHKLLLEPYQEAIDKYISLQGDVNAKNIHSLMISTLGEKLTADMFTPEGKDFATSYLTVTHWWYNLHTDFNRLYQEDGVKLPRAIKNQEEFDTLLKLLDIRHEQFKSKKDFNSNQNKAELQALIEGKEPPKRVVDLSFLEEELAQSDTPTTQKPDNILPDDFFKKE